jgi:hypothetical protein
MPCWIRRGVCVPVEFAGRDSCVAMERTGETCQMTSGKQPAPGPSVARWGCAGGPQRAVARRGCEGGSGSQGRAGFKPRRKPMLLCLPTACAESPAQSPPHGVDIRAFRRVQLATRSQLRKIEPRSNSVAPGAKARLEALVTAGMNPRPSMPDICEMACNDEFLAAAFPWPPAAWRLIYGTGIRNRAKPLKTGDRDPF